MHTGRFNAEIRQALAENRKLQLRNANGGLWVAVSRAAESIFCRCLLAPRLPAEAIPRLIDPREVAAVIRQIEAAHQWRLDVFGVDEFAEARARRTNLLARIERSAQIARKTNRGKTAQIADTAPRETAYIPFRGTFVRGGRALSLAAMNATADPANKRAAQLFGRKLREARRDKGLTQTELAALLGDATQHDISRWETGLHLPRGGRMMRLAALLDFQPFDATEEAPPAA